MANSVNNSEGSQRGSDTATGMPAEEKRSLDAASTLTANCMYKGTVTNSDIVTGLVDVTVGNIRVSNCQVAANAFASLVGITDNALPPKGATVLVLYFPEQAYVVGANLGSVPVAGLWTAPVSGDPSAQNSNLALKSLASTSQGEKTTPLGANAKLPKDLLPGERVMDSNIGAAFRLLLNVAQMSAGDLAKVETHLFNDMVRIVDNYFVHHSVGGDDIIWGNGTCNREEHFTSYQYEAEGCPPGGKQRIAGPGDAGTFDPSSEIQGNSASHTGRWRKSTYIGFLGDMIHTFVTQPTKLASTYMKDSFRAGNFRQWIGSDGTYMVQSAAGIQIEMNPHIVVPSISYAWNDPEFNIDEAMQKLDDSFLQIWGEGPDWMDLNVACWQMRTYLKYIPLWHSLARFKQLEKSEFCQIPTEAKAPPYSVGADETDRTRITGEHTYKGHCSILLDPSGSVTITSNNGASIIMNQGNIQVACEGNLEFKAGRSLILQGRDVVVHAARKLELVSFFGSIIQKARTAFDLLCEKGRMYLKSDAKKDDTENEHPLSTDPGEVKNNGYGIIIDASQSKTLVSSDKGTVIGTTGTEGHVCIETEGSKSDIRLKSTNHIALKAHYNLLTQSIGIGMDAFYFKFQGYVFKATDSFCLNYGSIKTSCVIQTSSSVMANSGFVGPSEYVGKNKDMEDVNTSNEKADEVGKMASELTQLCPPDQFKTNCLVDITWEFPEWAEPDSIHYPTSFKASLYEDTHNTGSGTLVTEQEEIPITALTLLSAPRTTPTAPWPGKSGCIMEFSDKTAPSLTEPWGKQFEAEDIATINSMTASPYKVIVSKIEL